MRVRAPTSTIRPSSSCRITTPARVARQPLGRFRGNANTAFEGRLTRLLRIGEHRGVDVHDDLVTLARRAGAQFMVERRRLPRWATARSAPWGASFAM